MELPSPLQTLRHSLRNMVTRPAVELDPVKAYDLWAATYDDSADNALLHVEASIVDRLIDIVDFKGKPVLDAGCGTGRHFHRIIKGGPSLLAGIDVSTGMLHQATDKTSTETPTFLHLASAEFLPFRDESFDLVISTLVLDHIPNLQGAIAEMCRALRSGGTLIVSSFHPFGKLLSWKRSFQAEVTSGQKTWFSARYYLHLHSDYFNALAAARMEILQMQEPVIDESIRPFYERAGRLDIFEKYIGYPMLLIFVARKR